MPRVFAANSSGVTIDNQAVEGVRAIDYAVQREQGDVFALGAQERITMYYGASRVKAQIRVASASDKLDALTTSGDKFQVVANLKHGQTARSVAFDECYMQSKDFSMGAGAHGETIYAFTATRVRETDASDAVNA
jgi:hypothetical protein